MSRFFSKKYRDLSPYVPGEQPQNREYCKLNTNESPFPPSPYAQRLAREEISKLELYSDPEFRSLRAVMAEKFCTKEENLIFGNGSDEILNFAFAAFCDRGAVFPDITYGFYPIFAKQNGVPYRTVPLNDDFSIPVQALADAKETVFLANPNAPTGIALPLCDIERIVSADPDRIVVVDEAYVDFGAESALGLLPKYQNLFVVGTFSKSRSMAGARLGYGIASPELICDLETLRNSSNPYNVNRITMAAGIGALCDEEYFRENCEKIMKNRQETAEALKRLGFFVTDSSANFLFARHPAYSGESIYRGLKEKGVLIRHFSGERIKDFNRITVGSDEQMETLLKALSEIMNNMEGNL